MRDVFVALAMLAGSTAAVAQPPAAAPPGSEADAIVCGLLDTCAPAAPSGAVRRSGATRGFSFTRPGAKPAKPTKRSAANAPVRTAPGKLDLRIGFVSGSATVSPDSGARVQAFATALLDPRLVTRRIRIEGHTDAVGVPAANLDLSKRRAEAVAALVTARGVDRARLDVEGYGDSQPVTRTAGASAANRRVVAVLVN